MRADWISLAGPFDGPHAALLGAVRRWLTEHVGRPQPALGRGGALCPFVPPALTRGTLYLGVIDGDAPAASVGAVLSHAAELRRLGTSDEDRAHRALILIYPDVPAAAHQQMRTLRQLVKPQLIPSGITCGEFYPESEDRSARNPEVRVARSPVACLALRHLMPHDALFLSSQQPLFELFLQWRRTHER